jgi:exosortase
MKFELESRGHMPIVPGSLALALKVTVLLATTLAVFFQDLVLIFNDAWQSEAMSYSLIVPVLLVYLVYRKRKLVKAVATSESPRILRRLPLNDVAGALLILVSFLLYWFGSYTFTPLEYHVFALPIFVAACVLLLFNTQTLRQLLFPVFFLFLLVPPPAEILYNVGALLSSLSSELAYHMLAFFGIPVILSVEPGTPTLFVTQQNGAAVQLAVDVACSGIYSLIGFLIFALFTAYAIRDKLWKKALIFCLGFPLIYFLNVLRITIIGVIGYYYGEDLALNVFHLFGGWVLIFLGTLILLVALERLFKVHVLAKPTDVCAACGKVVKTEGDFCFSCGRVLNLRVPGLNKKDVAKIFSLVLSVILIMSIQTPVFALTQGPPEVMVQTPQGGNVTTSILPEVPDYALRFLFRDEDFEKLAGQDRSLVYAYIPANASGEMVWVALEIASTGASLHRWEACLIKYPLMHGQQPRVQQIGLLNDTKLLENPPIFGRFFVFNSTVTNETQAVLYWYETSVFKVNGTSQQKQVKISLIAYPNGTGNLGDVEHQLLALAARLVGYWQPIKTWSQIALLISQNGDKLIIIDMIALCGIFTFYMIERRKERRQNTIAYSKLSTASRQIVDAVHEAENETLPTLGNISAVYASSTSMVLRKEDLLQKLAEAERIGMVRGRIAGKDDEPVQVWKTHVQFPKNSLSISRRLHWRRHGNQ